MNTVARGSVPGGIGITKACTASLVVTFSLTSSQVFQRQVASAAPGATARKQLARRGREAAAASVDAIAIAYGNDHPLVARWQLGM